MALWGKTDAPISRPGWVNVGQIKKVVITDGGSGYTSATATIAAPANGTQATATVNLTGDAVSSITITNPGDGYISTDAATVTITGDGVDAAATAIKAPVEYDAANVVFVDKEEALVSANKTRGITGAGWWLLKEYVDVDGTTRHKNECIVAMTVPTATSGDAADDATVADVLSTITVSAQPTDQDTVGGAATFTVTATVDNAGTVLYQWQRKAADGSRWTNVSAATTASLALTGQTADEDGDMYRVKLTSDNGAAEVISDAVTLTFDN